MWSPVYHKTPSPNKKMSFNQSLIRIRDFNFLLLIIVHVLTLMAASYKAPTCRSIKHDAHDGTIMHTKCNCNFNIMLKGIYCSGKGEKNYRELSDYYHAILEEYYNKKVHC